ncbi:MAG: nitroreductase family protein [Planctomycetota bacterium]|jgi:nitroreductase
MNEPTTSPRQAEASVDPIFLDRWSPRSYADRPVSAEDLASVFEAARWSPSCYNDQPWLFAYAQAPEDHARAAALLVEGNRVWAEKAPVIGVVFARRRFGATGKDNAWAGFDTGAAAYAMSLQASRLGLGTHLMGGFDAEASYEVFGVSKDDYQAMAGFVIGHPGPVDALPEAYREREAPSARKPLAEVAFEGRMDS